MKEENRHDLGVTLLEIMIALAVLGLLMWAAIEGVSRVTKSDLRRDAGRLAAAMRWAYDRAAATATHHRVVLDLDEETFAVEACEGEVRMYRTPEEAQAAERAAIEARTKAQPDVAAQGAEAAVGASVGLATCSPAQGQGQGQEESGKVQKFRKDRGMGIKRVFATHLEHAVDSGRAEINFFPMGRGERAVIEVGDGDDNLYSLIAYGLSGRIRVVNGDRKDPQGFVRGETQ